MWLSFISCQLTDDVIVSGDGVVEAERGDELSVVFERQNRFLVSRDSQLGGVPRRSVAAQLDKSVDSLGLGEQHCL